MDAAGDASYAIIAFNRNITARAVAVVFTAYEHFFALYPHTERTAGTGTTGCGTRTGCTFEMLSVCNAVATITFLVFSKAVWRGAVW